MSAAARIAGTTPESIAWAEDREQFAEICRNLGLKQPPAGIARSPADAAEVVDQVGLPVIVRPSFVLGGRRMRVIYSLEELGEYMREVYGDVDPEIPGGPVLIDRFLEAAVEVDVDAVYDGSEILLGGVMEHVEEAGVHSGDSDCVTPPPTLSEEALKEILRATGELAASLFDAGLPTSLLRLEPQSAQSRREVVGSGDYDGDGRTDLLLRLRRDRTLSVWTLNGARVKRKQSVAELEPGWLPVGVADESPSTHRW